MLTFKILHQNKYMIGSMWLLEGIQKFENLRQSCLDLVNYIFAKIYLVGGTVPLKVRSGQIGSAREWYFWTGLEKDFLFFLFLI
jgi:hypothetical protein